MSSYKDSTQVSIVGGNRVMSTKVAAVLSPGPAPMSRLLDDTKERSMLLGAFRETKTRSIIVTDRHHAVLSAVLVKELTQRFTGGGRT